MVFDFLKWYFCPSSAFQIEGNIYKVLSVTKPNLLYK